MHLPADPGTGLVQIHHVRAVSQLFAGHRFAVELGGHLGEDDVLVELVGFADEDAAGLGEPFEDERSGHDREAGKVIGEVIFGEAEAFHGRGRPPRLERREPIDPSPPHKLPI